MKKFLLLFMALFAMAATHAAEVTFSLKGLTWTADTHAEYGIGYETTSNGFSIAIYQNTGSNPYSNLGNSVRFYAGNCMVIESQNGATITGITLTPDGNYWQDLTFNGDLIKYQNQAWTWTGSATTVSIINEGGSQNRFSQITITTEGVNPPTFSPEGGTYYMPQTVTLSAPDTEEIWYTLDGSDPTAAGVNPTTYTEPINITSTTTIKAVALDADGNSSEVVEATYTFETISNIAEFLAIEEGSIAPINCTLTFIYQSGNYSYVTDGTGYLQIYGSISQTYTNGDVVAAGIYGRRNNYRGTEQMHLQLISGDDASWAASQFGEPTSTGNTVSPIDVIDLSTITAADCNKYVKLIGVNATASTVSDGTTSLAINNLFDITVPESGAYDVIGFINPYTTSAGTTLQIYPIDFAASSKPAMPKITSDTEADTYYNLVTVTITAAEGTDIYYTLNGDNPTTGSTPYSEPFTISDFATTTVKAIAVANGISSNVATAEYVIAVAMPVFSVEPGTYNDTQTVEITSETTGAQIYYTTDGTTTPDATNGTLYEEAITVDNSMTIMAIAVSGEVVSEVANAEYTIARPGDSVAGKIDLTDKWDVLEADGADGASGKWSTGYADRGPFDYKFATVTFQNAAKQSSTITDCPVISYRNSKNGQCIIKLSDTGNTMTAVSFYLKQWNKDDANVTLEYSTDGDTFISTGDEYTFATTTSNATYTLSNSSLPAGTIAVRVNVTNKDERVGVMSADVTYDVASGIEAVEAFDGVKVIGQKGMITVTGEAGGVEVYTLGGALVSRGRSTVACPAGIYIVKANGRAYKVIVK